MSLQLPFGVAPVNPVPVDAHSGPYTGVDLSAAVASANSSIASGVRFQSMEVRIVVSGVSYKYWYNSGTANSDLTPFSINDNTSYINTVSGNLQTQITDNSNDINTVSGLIVTNSADSGIELVGSTFIMGGTGSLDKLNITSIDSNQVPLTVKGAAAQAEKLQEWQDSSANVVAYIDKDGNALFSGLTALGDLDVSGTLTFIHSTNVTIADKQLELASNSGSAISGDAYIDQGGIVLKSINGDKEWIWRDSTDAWTASDNIDVGSNSVIFDGISQTIAYTGQETNVSGYFNTVSGNLQSQITSNDSDITTLQTATGNLDARVTQNASNVTTVSGIAQGAASDVTTASGHLQTQITANDSDINTVSGIAQGASSDVATASGHLQTQITSNDSDITALQTATGNLDTRVTQNASDVATASGHLQTQITANDSDINTVSGIAQGASSDVATASGHLQTQITSNDSDITALQTATGNLDTRVTQNASDVATASGHLQTQITANDSDINTVSGIAQGASSDVATASGHLQTQITANDSDITALQTATGNLDTRVTQNASNIATASGHLQTQITANDSDINTVSGIAQGASSDVATASGHLQTQITANDSDITALQTATGNLDTRVTQNASDVATASGHLQTQITANDSDINTVSGIAQGASSDVATASGHLQTQITANDSDITALQTATGNLDTRVTQNASNIATASGHLQTQITANDSDINTVSGIAQGAASDVATASGHLQTQITANDSDINTVSGIAQGAVSDVATASGHLQTQITANDSDINTVSGLLYNNWNVNVTGNSDSITSNQTVTFTGAGLSDVSYNSSTNTVTISGQGGGGTMDSWNLAVNGDATSIGDGETVDFTGQGDISILRDGNTVKVSGGSQDLSSYATTSYVNTVSGNLQSQITLNDTDINIISGVAQGAADDVTIVSGIAQSASDNISTASGHLQTQITANDSDINTVSGIAQGAVSDVATASGHLQTQITANDSDITALQTATGNLDTRVTQNASDVATASGHLQTQITANDSDINTVSGIAQGAASDVATASGHLQTQITSNDSDITALQTATGNLDTRVTQNASNVTIVSGIAQGAASDVATASGHLQTQITANDSDINTVSGIAQGAASDVATASGHLQTQITSNDSDITALQTATGNLDTRVTQNASNVTIVSGIAQGAADDVTTVSGLIPNFTADSGIDLIGSTFVMGGTGNLDQLNITSISSSQVPLTIKGAAAQSANLQEWQSSAGTVLARIDDDGIPYFHSIRFDLETDDNIFLTTSSYLGHPNGTKNIAIGEYAGDAGSGTSTVFMGEQAGFQSYTESSFIGGKNAGTIAGRFSNPLFKSVLIGRSAGSYHQGGTNNVFLGHQAGAGHIGDPPSGDYNIYIGTLAGSRAVGNRNIEILTSGITFTSILDEYNNKIHIENTIIGDTSSKLIAIGDVGTGNLTPDATLEILPAASTDVGLIVQGATSQNANLQEWQNTAGTTLAYVDSDGNAMFSGIIALGDLEVSGELTYISSTNVTIVDKQLELASNSGSAVGDDSHVDQGGIVLKSTNGDKEWIWRSATDSWTTNKNINVGSNAVIFDGISQTIAYTGQLQDLTGYATTGSLNIVSGIAQGAASDVATASGHLQTQITSNDSDITALQTATGNLDTRVTQNASNVTIVSGIAQGAASDVATASGHLQTQITSNDSDITALQTATGNLDTRVTQNANDIDTVSGVAYKTFAITNDGSSNYVFDGMGLNSANDPNIYLHKGHTYYFDKQIASHPFRISATDGGSVYQDADGNNIEIGGQGVLKFEVPQDAPDKLYYFCTSHPSSMKGEIYTTISIDDITNTSGHLQTQITSNDTDITALQTATGVLRTDINNNDTDITALQTATGNLDTRVTQNASNISSASGHLQTQITSNDSDITTLQTATGVLRTDINSNNTDIAALQTATGNLDTRVTQNASNISSASGHLQTQITSNDSDITTLQTATGVLRTDINNNDTDISTVSGLLYNHWVASDGSTSGTISALNTLTFSESGQTSIAFDSGTNTLTIGSTGAGGGAGTNWNLSVEGNSTNIGDGETVDFTGQGGVTLTRSSNSVIISGGGTTYTAGSGLVLDGNEFNVHGGSGNFQYVELKSSSQDPQLYFLGSGSNDTPITLNVLSSFQSASSSGSALVFDGTEGQLFGITDNLSSGVIFSVSDIAGLPLIEADASGDVKLIEFGRYVGVGTGTPEYQLDVFGTGRFSEGIIFPDGNRQTIAYTGGGGGGGSSPTGTASGVAFFGSDNSLTTDSNFYWDTGNQRLRLSAGAGTDGTALIFGDDYRISKGNVRLLFKVGGSDFAAGILQDGSAGRISVDAGGYYSWTDSVGTPHGSPTLKLYRDVADTLALRRGSNAQEFRIYHSGDTSNYERLSIKATGYNYEISPQVNNGTAGSVVITNDTSSKEILVVKGAASQSANLQEWQDSAGTVKASINQNGYAELNGFRTSDNVNFNGSAGNQLTFSNANTTFDHQGYLDILIDSNNNGTTDYFRVSKDSRTAANILLNVDNDGNISGVGTGIFQSGVQFPDGVTQTVAYTGQGGGGGGGSTSPGGSNTQIQFNNAGSFGGDANFTWDYNTDALTVSGSTLISNTGTVFEVTNTGGTTLFAVEDSDEVQVIVAKQAGQTSNPFEVRDEFDVSVASIDVSGNISGNNIIFGDGTVQTTAATGGGGGGMSSWNLSVTGDSTSITNGETIVFSGQDAITTTRDGNTVIISGAAGGGGGGGSTTGTSQNILFYGGDNNLAESTDLRFDSGNARLYIGNSSNYIQSTYGNDLRITSSTNNHIQFEPFSSYMDIQGYLNRGQLRFSTNTRLSNDNTANVLALVNSSNEQEFRIYHSGNSDFPTNYERLSIKATGYNYEISPQVNNGTAGSVVITNDTSSKEILVVKGAASQSANLQEWKRSDDQHLMSVDENGNVLISGGGDSSNLCSMEIKSTGADSKVILKNYLNDTAYVHMQGGQRSSKFGQGGAYANYGGAWQHLYANNQRYVVMAGTQLTLGTTTSTTAIEIDGQETTIVSGLTVGGDTDISGALTATTKSFLIDHPTKEGMKLQYGSLEGPENGVYVRGTTDLSTIELPDYWVGLVDENSITVSLTPVGSFQQLYVEDKNSKQITVGGVWGSYDYVVYAERKDVDKLEVEW